MEGLERRERSLNEERRGWVGEMIRSDETSLRPMMAYLSLTRTGIVRGPHEHKEQTDCFCLVGKFRIYLWDNRKGSATYGEHKTIDTSDVPTMVVIPPGIVHAYKNIGSSDSYVINMPDRLYRGRGKKEEADEVRYENEPDSQFKID